MAARAEFARKGYDGASLRGIAREAGVDPALLHHYFAGKAALFAEALRLPVPPGALVTRLLDGPAHEAGRRMVSTFLSVWDDPSNTPRLAGLLRGAATHDHAARQIREFVAAETMIPVIRGLGDADDPSVPLRAGLAAAHVLGLAFMRYVLAHPPVADAPANELAELMGPALQTYLAPDA